MDSRAARVLRTLMVVLVVSPPVLSVSCPRPCSCPQPSELHCTFRSLFTFPAAVPKHVERMNLGFNSIHTITSQSLAGLRKLELLMVHGNDIHALPDGVFRDLVSLQMLKLSFNKLRLITRHTLQGLKSLARLHLDHNRLEFIHPDSFLGLTSLRLLQLEGNQLQQLHPASFSTFTVMSHFHVSTLKHLYLSDNQLSSLPSSLVATMPQLENLFLHGNPWTCDCNLNWLHEWDNTSPGVLKCKKSKGLPGGQLCPMCSSPVHLKRKELPAVKNLVCSGPVIRAPHRTVPPEDTESEVMTPEDFKEPIGNITLGLTDEHGNEVDLDCGVGQLRESTRVNWEQVDQRQLAANVTLSVDIDCPMNREIYERLWRLIAYYSSVPVHLQRGVMLTKEPHPTYVYRQDPERDALYYTGVKVNMVARPAWLMQNSVDLQLNRLQSSAKMIKLIYSTFLSQTVEVEQAQTQQMKWVQVESTNTTRKVVSAILGSRNQMDCAVHSSGPAAIHWMLPDGTKVKAPSTGPDDRMFVSANGSLVFKSVRHTDTGVYYCVAEVHGDLGVLPFHLTVQESSSPPPGEDSTVDSMEVLAGNPISLHCPTSASPDAEIHWILPNNKIISIKDKPIRVHVFSNGTLHIPQTQWPDSGYYKCIAMNQHGVDTLAAKLTVIRRNGLIRPLKKFAVRPQSASGVSAFIHTDEASGDGEAAPEISQGDRQDVTRGNIPGGVAPGRRGIHPSKSIRHRPTVLRKPTIVSTKDRKHIVESRRRVNVSKTKIDPEKWADILAKIKNRNVQNPVTSPPSIQRQRTQQTTQQPETNEGSSDGIALQTEGTYYFTTTNTQVPQTQMNTYNAPSQESGQHAGTARATTQPQTMQTAQSGWHTTHDADLDQYRTNDEESMTGSPSVPPLVTVWPSRASGSTSSPQENLSTDGDVVVDTTDSWTKAAESSESVNSESHREPPSSTVSPTVNQNQRGSGKHSRDMTTTSRPQPRDTTVNDYRSQAMLTTAFSATAPALTTERASPHIRKPNSTKRNGGRRKRPNRRKQKQKESDKFATTALVKTVHATIDSTAPVQPKIEPLEVTTAIFKPTVPFTGSQAASPERLSHRENTTRHKQGPNTKLPVSPSEPRDHLQPLAKTPIESASAQPPFPSASPTIGHGKTSSPTVSRVWENKYLEASDMFTVTTQQALTVETAGAWVTGGDGHDGNSNEDLHTSTVRADVDHTKRDTPTKADKEKMLTEEPGMNFPTVSGSIAGYITPTQSLFLGDSEMEKSTMTKPEQSESYYDIVSDHTTPSSESEVDQHPEETTNIVIMAPSIESVTMSLHPLPATSQSPDPIDQNKEVPHDTATKTYSERTRVKPVATAHGDTSVTIKETSTPEPQNTWDYHSVTESPKHRLTSPTLKSMISQATPTSSITVIPTSPSRERTSANNQDVSTVQQLPGRGSMTRGKPRIIKADVQTYTVKAGADAQLPCEARGEPKPFMSWTQVSTGASIAQNTRVQRFGVSQNGTLLIANTQDMDGGQYLCTVQNQYGTDQMLVSLVVLSQPPQVLHPWNRDVTAHLGDKVDLECKVDGHPPPRVLWVLPNHVRMAAAPIGRRLQQRVAVLSNGTLQISRAGYADRGIYQCIGSNSAGTDSVSVHLHVSASPPVIQQTQFENTTLPEGSNVYVHCSATGAPQPAIHWVTPDGTQLNAVQFLNRRNLLIFPNGTLYIKRLEAGNAGRYECLATNMVLSSRRTVIVNMMKKQSFSKARITSSSPQKSSVIYGQQLLLNCVTNGEPHPWIVWRTPSKKLVDLQYSFDPRIKVYPNGTLTIQSVTDKDGGDYLCVARNKLGDDYVLLWVDVLTRPAKIEHKQQRSSQEVVYGGALKVDCVASGLPNPQISWGLPDGTMVNLVKQRDHVSGGRSRRYLVFDNGTLYFNDVGMPEEGDYTCYAENQVGKDEMKVRVKVKTATRAPQIQDKDKKLVKAFYGETVILRCNAKGEPRPTVTWISPTNRVISPALDKHQLLDDGSLVVQRVQRFDGGNYSCMARNGAGHDNKVVRLEVMVTPPTINGLTDTAVTITTVQDQRQLLDCVAKGKPTPRVMWVLPGNVILPAPYRSNRMTVHQNGTLEIRSPKRTDSGNLACIARNEGGEVRLEVKLDVREGFEKPQIRGPKSDSRSLTVGRTMTLNCSFDGSPLSQVTWILPNGTSLLRGARFSKFFHHLDGSLIISNPSFGEAGLYRCRGLKSGGFVERTVVLSPGKKPEIANSYSSPVSVMNGELLSLHCLTHGEPLRLTWTLPSGVVLNRPQRAGRYSVLPNGTLAIQQASVYDRGAYVCRAANEYGSSQLSAAVTVIAFPPQITHGPLSVTFAKRGVAMQLNCKASGVPKAEVAWETPDKMRLAVSAQPRLYGNKYLHPEGSLVIQSPTHKDTGLYRCTARNALGVDSRTTYLNVY